MAAIRAFLATLSSVRRLGRVGWLLVAAMLLLDALAIGGNLIYLTVDEPGREPHHPVFSDTVWNGDIDWSWMERVGWIQLLGAVAGLVLLRRRDGDGVYLVLAAVVLWVVLDDAARLHELGGNVFLRLGVEPVGPVGAQQLGELAVWAVAGSITVVALWITYRRAGATARHRTQALIVALAVLVGFALVVDTIDSSITPYVNSWVQTGMALAENGGELVSMTVIAVIVLVQVMRADEPVGAQRSPAAP